MTHGIPRRALLAAGVLAPVSAGCAHAGAPIDPLSGDSLWRDVDHYARLGDHRTASRGDEATSVWLRERFQALGFAVETPRFAFPLFEPTACDVTLGQGRCEAFPVWPPKPTEAAGVTAALTRDLSKAQGAIVIIDLPYRPGGSLTAGGTGELISAAVGAGAVAVVAVTEGPTGAIIGQNADPTRFSWDIPVVLVGGADQAHLRAAAERGEQACVRLTGKAKPDATASNLVARRPGRGKTVVLSTPKSGWFSCAGERGSGMAIFLAMADVLSKRKDLDLLFLSTSGHEIEGLGGRHFIESTAPKPEAVRLWLHIGANIACDALELSNTAPRPVGRPTQRRGLLASAMLQAAIREAFAGQIGYATPVDVDSPSAVGEVVVFRDAGYRPLIGLVGAAPLHHTPLDRAALATSPQILEPVAQALAKSVISALSR